MATYLANVREMDDIILFDTDQNQDKHIKEKAISAGKEFPGYDIFGKSHCGDYASEALLADYNSINQTKK